MRKLLGLFALLAFSSLPAFAQLEAPKIEVGGGYAYRSFDFPPASNGEGGTVNFPRANMNGWDANAVYNVNRFIGVVGDVDGTRNAAPDPFSGTDITWVYTVMGGARVYPLGHHRLTPFVEGLVGHGFLTITAPVSSGCSPGCKLSDGSFAWAIGGGVDYSLSHHFAVRLGEFDYEQTSFDSIADTFDGLSATNRNYKFKAGLLVRF